MFSNKKYMYSESVLNSSYVYVEVETSKEILAGLKEMLTFLSRAVRPPRFVYFLIKVTLPYSSYICPKNITMTFLKTLFDDILQYSS